MSKGKSRCVRTLPINKLLYHHPLPELLQHSVDINKSSEKQYFGEYITERIEDKINTITNENIVIKEEQNINPSSDDSVDSIILDINNLAFTRSSSSSISWNDEYRNEATRKVEEELYKMENILSGLEPIPNNYDSNEYKEWMETFPSLCIVGSSIDYRHSSYYEPFDESCDEEELFAIHPAHNKTISDCDISQTSTSELNHLKNQIKKAVIERIFKNISKEIIKLKCKHYHQENKYLTNNNTKFSILTNNNSDKLVIDVDNYLKISPVGQYIPRYLNERRPSSKALISSQISSSKWLKDESPEYLSLPFLAENFNVNNNSSSLYCNIDLNIKNKNRPNLNTTKNFMSQRKSINSIILPPIEVNNQFRSISATPRRNIDNNKCLSALSMKLNRDFNKKSATELRKCYEFPKKPSNRLFNLGKFSLCED